MHAAAHVVLINIHLKCIGINYKWVKSTELVANYELLMVSFIL